MDNAFPFAAMAAAAVIAALTLSSTPNADGQVQAQAQQPADAQPVDAVATTATTHGNIPSLSDVLTWKVVDGKLATTWKYPKLPSELWRFQVGVPPMQMVASGRLDLSRKGNFRILSRGLGRTDVKEHDANRFSLENDQVYESVGLT